MNTAHGAVGSGRCRFGAITVCAVLGSIELAWGCGPSGSDGTANPTDLLADTAHDEVDVPATAAPEEDDSGPADAAPDVTAELGLDDGSDASWEVAFDIEDADGLENGSKAPDLPDQWTDATPEAIDAAPDDSTNCDPAACPNDGLACTEAVCLVGGVCANVVSSGWCLIDGVCVASGTAGGPCLACRSEVDAGAWSPGGDGTPCNDGSVCTQGEVCTNGACGGGVAVSCDDGDPCTVDLCDPEDGCSHVGASCGDDCGSAASCSDWEVCDTQRGACVGQMAAVPAGPFWMGCKDGDSACEEREKPIHEVTLDAYEVDLTEVTNAAYAGFLSAHGNDCGETWCVHAKEDGWNDYIQVKQTVEGWEPEPGMGANPIVQVTWFGARGYCAWAGKALCTEGQWEKAARGGCELYPGKDCRQAMPLYPWGNEMASCVFAVMSSSEDEYACGQVQGSSYTLPVGSRALGASPYGLLDMAGNVFEWVSDWYDPDYYEVSPAVNPLGPYPDQPGSVIRGGASGSYPSGVRSSERETAGPYGSSPGIGFRCCRSPAP